jgi:hypothetical protein
VRPWCLTDSNLTVEKSVLAGLWPQGIVKLIPRDIGNGESTYTGRSQAGKPQATCMEKKILSRVQGTAKKRAKGQSILLPCGLEAGHSPAGSQIPLWKFEVIHCSLPRV